VRHTVTPVSPAHTFRQHSDCTRDQSLDYCVLLSRGNPPSDRLCTQLCTSQSGHVKGSMMAAARKSETATSESGRRKKPSVFVRADKEFSETLRRLATQNQTTIGNLVVRIVEHFDQMAIDDQRHLLLSKSAPGNPVAGLADIVVGLIASGHPYSNKQWLRAFAHFEALRRRIKTLDTPARELFEHLVNYRLNYIAHALASRYRQLGIRAFISDSQRKDHATTENSSWLRHFELANNLLRYSATGYEQLVISGSKLPRQSLFLSPIIGLYNMAASLVLGATVRLERGIMRSVACAKDGYPPLPSFLEMLKSMENGHSQIDTGMIEVKDFDTGTATPMVEFMDSHDSLIDEDLCDDVRGTLRHACELLISMSDEVDEKNPETRRPENLFINQGTYLWIGHIFDVDPDFELLRGYRRFSSSVKTIREKLRRIDEIRPSEERWVSEIIMARAN
jgi:hypothetical protein